MNNSIRPGKVWLDTNGKPIQAHGACVFYENGVYYWIGENKEFTDGKNKKSGLGVFGCMPPATCTTGKIWG